MHPGGTVCVCMCGVCEGCLVMCVQRECGCVRVSVCLSVCLPVARLLSQEGRGLGLGQRGGLGSAKGRG